ncbi:hypothetical protein F4808DRAFT_454813 [Astrocystis sublimbata]|nr:hypothetical protein F4808DRAFT_454813 [Astrocystis sublimbata]
MASALAALKSLVCPAGDGCTAFQCLFSHPNDKKKKKKEADDEPKNSQVLNHHNSYKASATFHARPDEAGEDSSNKTLQRKRIKLDEHSSTVSHHDPTVETGASNTLPDEQSMKPSAATPKIICKDNSPGVTANNPSSAAASNKQTHKQQDERHQSLTADPPAPANSKTRPPVPWSKQVRKGPESLNPRLLKKAPASHPTRVALVKAMHKELKRLNDELKKTAQGEDKKLVLTEQELIVRTLDEEEELAIKKTSIYNTSIRNKILKYKKMNVVQYRDSRAKEVQSSGDISSTQTPPTAPPESIMTGLTVAQEIDFLPRLVYDLAPLASHGYISTIPSQEAIEGAQAAVKACGNTEACDRCTRRFQVFPGRREEDGALASNGSCTYHPGKSYLVDRSKSQRRFKCCQRTSDDDAGGCMTAPHHVFKTTDPKRLASVLNFVNTPVNPKVPKDRAVAFDCEMGYTVHGLELIRITVVSWPAGEILLDVLVRPVGEVLDLNTRFSGVRPEDMATAEPCEVGSDHKPIITLANEPAAQPKQRLKIVASPKIARDLLFTLISAETPLIGHGLENDLNAARIIHPTCIDTVILWPHSRGLPMRNGLKYLMETELGRKIQADPTEGLPEGHDSAEDARAAGDLVRLKIRDEWKTMQMRGWTLSAEGKILAPSEEWTVVGGARTKKH